MCVEIGVDPLQSQAGFWSQFTGLGDFYRVLSIKIIDVCLKLKKKNSGFIQISTILDKVLKTYGQNPPALSPNDIKKAISNLDEIGNGYTVVKIGGEDYLKIVNFDLDSDSDQLIQLVNKDGYFDQTALNSLPLEPEHIQGILHSLLEQGIIWVDFKTTPTRYYILAAFQGFDI